jgi:hypothetical protein
MIGLEEVPLFFKLLDPFVLLSEGGTKLTIAISEVLEVNVVAGFGGADKIVDEDGEGGTVEFVALDEAANGARGDASKGVGGEGIAGNSGVVLSAPQRVDDDGFIGGGEFGYGWLRKGDVASRTVDAGRGRGLDRGVARDVRHASL